MKKELTTDTLIAARYNFDPETSKPPTVMIDGEIAGVVALLEYTISEIIDEATKRGMERAKAERNMVRATQQAIMISRAEANRKATQEEEKNHDKNES